MSVTLNVRGQKLRTQTQRRYVAVAVRTEPFRTEHGTYVPFAHVEKRSDNIQTVRAAQRRYGRSCGAFVVIFDTTTGEEVS